MANYLEFVAGSRFAIAAAGGGWPFPFNYLYQRDELGLCAGPVPAAAMLITMTGFAGPGLPGTCWTGSPPGWAHGPTQALPELRQVALLSTDGPYPRRGVHRGHFGPRGLGEANPGAAGGPNRQPHGTWGDILLHPRAPPAHPRASWSPTTRCCGTRLCIGADQGHTRMADGILFSLPCYHNVFGYPGGACLSAVCRRWRDHPARPRSTLRGTSPAIERHRGHRHPLRGRDHDRGAVGGNPARRRGTTLVLGVSASCPGAAPAPILALWETGAHRPGSSPRSTNRLRMDGGPAGADDAEPPGGPPWELHSSTVPARVKMAGRGRAARARWSAVRVPHDRPDDRPRICRRAAKGELVSRGPRPCSGSGEKPGRNPRRR